MRTYVIEGICTALSSISHNGGERNGTIVQLRREKFVQDNGSVTEIPVISGNSVRGKLRDLAAIDILTRPDGTKIQVDADTFNLLFSGGSLESVGNKHLDIEKVRKLRKDIPVLSVLGCSIGNVILPGKVDIGKMIPICKETLAYIPEKYHGKNIKTIWEYCQVEMNTRRDDTKDENKREFIKEGFLTDDLKGGQMMYHTETLVSGTKFYWKICLRDTTDKETGAFLSLIQQWAKQSSQVGGNGRVGHGKLKLDLQETYVVDSEIEFKNSDFVNYINAAEEAKTDTNEYFEQGLQEEFFK
jgi:hypothetical protein